MTVWGADGGTLATSGALGAVVVRKAGAASFEGRIERRRVERRFVSLSMELQSLPEVPEVKDTQTRLLGEHRFWKTAITTTKEFDAYLDEVTNFVRAWLTQEP